MAIAGLGMPVLALGTLGAIEITEITGARSKMQSNVDGAALKGARELTIDSSPATVERARVAADGAADPLRLRWTITTSASTDAAAGTITVTQDGWRPSFFGNLLPPGGFKSRATATASLVSGLPLCVLGLEGTTPGVMALQGAANLLAPDCLVQSNNDLTAAGASRVRAGSVRTVGAASGSISPAPLTDAPRVADPFSSMPINVPNRCDDIVLSILAGTVTLNPGVHCGAVSLLGAAKIILNPGEHYFVGGALNVLGTTEITGTDVVVVLKGLTGAQFAGNSTLTLEGRKSGPYAGFVLVADRSFVGDLSISTHNAKKLLGTIYIPNGTLAVSGAGNRVADQSPWTVVVARRIDLRGSPELTINSNYLSSTVPRPQAIGGVRLTQ